MTGWAEAARLWEQGVPVRGIAEAAGVNYHALRAHVANHRDEFPKRKGHRERVTYVVYRGDAMIAFGKASEVAEALGVRPGTVRWYASPACMRRAGDGDRLYAIRIGGDGDGSGD